MVRGMYTGASSMQAYSRQLDVVANNLANVGTIGFKRDEAILKSFPEMLIRRFNDDGILPLPLGSTDLSPIVGKIGTGVEVNEIYTNLNSQGSIRNTENPLDFALFGEGFFTVEDDKNNLFYTRNGSFAINSENYLVTKEGYRVHGEKGHIRLQNNNYYVNDEGYVFVRTQLAQNLNRPTQVDQDLNADYEIIDQIKVMNFPYNRYLERKGHSLYTETNESGYAFLQNDFKLKQNFLEMSNVNPVYEMVKMIEADRSYEAAQKTVVSADQTLDRLINTMTQRA